MQSASAVASSAPVSTSPQACRSLPSRLLACFSGMRDRSRNASPVPQIGSGSGPGDASASDEVGSFCSCSSSFSTSSSRCASRPPSVRILSASRADILRTDSDALRFADFPLCSSKRTICTPSGVSAIQPIPATASANPLTPVFRSIWRNVMPASRPSTECSSAVAQSQYSAPMTAASPASASSAIRPTLGSPQRFVRIFIQSDALMLRLPACAHGRRCRSPRCTVSGRD